MESYRGNGNRVKVNVTDITGKMATYVLVLKGALSNYTLDLTKAPAGFDLAHVKEIVFVFKGNDGTLT